MNLCKYLKTRSLVIGLKKLLRVILEVLKIDENQKCSEIVHFIGPMCTFGLRPFRYLVYLLPLVLSLDCLVIPKAAPTFASVIIIYLKCLYKSILNKFFWGKKGAKAVRAAS